MVILYCTKLFLDGILKGLTVDFRMSFQSAAEAADWAKRARKGQRDHFGTRSHWRLVDASFQNYARG
jgi:hypothetical protein